MSDWWSKKLAGEKPPIDRTTTPPVQVPLRFQTPANVSPTVPQTLPQETQTVTSSEPPQSLSEALRGSRTAGGEAARKENLRCPDCGSAYVFSRSKGTMVNGASPAPRCYECGWNGMYDQGQQGSWS